MFQEIKTSFGKSVRGSSEVIGLNKIFKVQISVDPIAANSSALILSFLLLIPIWFP
jgi:hypothetical protein